MAVLTRREHRAKIETIGFTLIELIVVIAIVALLMGILMPALSAAKKQAMRVKCANSLRQIGVGLWSYSMDQRNRMPEYYGDPGLTFDTLAMRLPDGRKVNLGLLLSYVTDPHVFYCEADRGGLSPDITFDTLDNPWNNGAGQSGNWLSAGYTARYEKATASERHRDIDLYANQAVFTEFLGVNGWDGGGRFAGPVFAPHNNSGYNLLFGDGGVHWVQTTAINSLRPIGRVSPTPEDMYDYYQLLDVLPAGGGGQPIAGGGDDGGGGDDKGGEGGDDGGDDGKDDGSDDSDDEDDEHHDD